MRVNFLYIDPGTGSMLFTVLLGISSALYFSIKLLFIKFKHKLLGGKIKLDNDKIPFVLFSESKTYFNIFNPICRELDSFGKKILYITSSSNDPMLSNEYNNVDVEVIENQNNRWYCIHDNIYDTKNWEYTQKEYVLDKYELPKTDIYKLVED